MESRICRICRLVDLNEFNSRNIFNFENYEIVAKLQICSSIQLERNDNLPQFICDECEKSLNSAFDFRLRCECSDEYFRNSTKLCNNICNNNGYNIENNLDIFENTDPLNVRTLENTGTFDELIETAPDNIDSNDISKRSTQSMCELCGAVLTSTHNLRRHVAAVHKKILSLICDICDKKFARSDMLKRHMDSMHNDLKKYKCNIDDCNIGFRTKIQLRLHEARVHFKNHFTNETKSSGKIEKRHQCSVCNRKFTCNSLLQEHLNWHRGEKNHFCEICGKSFGLRIYLLIHKRIHTGKKPYECDICKKRFIQQPHLITHKYIHSKIKSFTCEFCGGTFKYETSLRDHKKKSCNVLRKENRCNTVK